MSHTNKKKSIPTPPAATGFDAESFQRSWNRPPAAANDRHFTPYPAAFYSPLMYGISGGFAQQSVETFRHAGTREAGSQAPANDARAPASKRRRLLALPLYAVAAGVQRLWRYILREREISRSMALLSNMDDRMLRDIGISRSDIGHVTRYGVDKSGRINQPHP